MAKARRMMEDVGMSMHEFGMKMGYSPEMAHKSVSRLFRRTTDVRLSTLEAIARVLDVDVKDLL
jgi:DNA-binding Xre family transcriptional regulator